VGRKKEKWKNGLLALSEGENAEYKITIAKKKTIVRPKSRGIWKYVLTKPYILNEGTKLKYKYLQYKKEEQWP
jgi:hypothetical protein